MPDLVIVQVPSQCMLYLDYVSFVLEARSKPTNTKVIASRLIKKILKLAELTGKDSRSMTEIKPKGPRLLSKGLDRILVHVKSQYASQVPKFVSNSKHGEKKRLFGEN